MKRWQLSVVVFMLFACIGLTLCKIEVSAQTLENECHVTNGFNNQKGSQDDTGETHSGTCGAQGDNLTWHLDEEGTLTISGNGEMEDYGDFNNPPWYIYCCLAD